MGIMEYLFIAITQTWSGIPIRVPSMGQIDIFKNYSYLIEPCAQKKTLKKQLHKKCNHEHTMNVIP